MRITGGERRGMKLAEPKGMAVRPTTDKVKAAIFNAIQWDVRDAAVFVDCFGGTGAMALEALSRGVDEAWIFDKAPKSIRLIRQNVAKARYEARAHIVETPAASGLRQLAAAGVQADLVFMDPPYRMTEAPAALAALISEKKIMKSQGILMIEHEKSVIMPLIMGDFTQMKHKVYGITAVDFYRYAGPEQEGEGERS
jgi:16S rRNA (guanine966-N2)-methyltransferase